MYKCSLELGGNMFEKLEKLQLIILSLIITAGIIFAANIVTKSISKDVITVTGSYSENVTSDNGRFEFELNARKPTKVEAYNTINNQRPVVIKYLETQGFKPEEIEIKSFQGYNSYKVTPNGMSTNEIAYFNASQTISVKSNDVNKIKKISTEINNLISKGIDINVLETAYFYSELPEIKVKLLEEATKDAKQRASAMLKATNNKVGKIQSVKMGVFQITPVDSTNVSDMGISDTSTIEKKITSVANVTFIIK